MNTPEGMRRLSRAIRLIGIFLGVALGGYGYKYGSWPFIVIGVIILAGALLLEWVVAGFGAPSAPDKTKEEK